MGGVAAPLFALAMVVAGLTLSGLPERVQVALLVVPLILLALWLEHLQFAVSRAKRPAKRHGRDVRVKVFWYIGAKKP
jgi:lipopolysaccharide export LptBFGC system permease protein LptF